MDFMSGVFGPWGHHVAVSGEAVNSTWGDMKLALS